MTVTRSLGSLILALLLLAGAPGFAESESAGSYTAALVEPAGG